MEELISPYNYQHTSQFLNDNLLKVYVDSPTRFTRNMIATTDEMVSFDIKVLKKPKHAEVAFYERKSMPELYDYAAGLCIPTEKGYTILVKKFANDKKYVYLHEWGHALGLEHPHDDRDGDVWYDTDTNDTVMSYKWIAPVKAFRPADVDTITGLYKTI